MGGGAAEVEVSGLAYASERAGPGSLFFCVPGSRADGHDFAAGAVERGAAALVCERPLGLGVPEVVVPDARAAMAAAAARFYGDPTRELRVAGITGTNGKTTTAFLLRAMLEQAGVRTGLLGTVTSIVGGREEPVERTTPEAIDLQASFRRMLDAGDRACAMEVSSHALALGRTAGVRFACRAFTNLTQDHLDFHAGMEDYFAAKRALFAGAPPGEAIVNAGDAHGRRLIAELGPGTVTFAVEDGSSGGAGAGGDGGAGAGGSDLPPPTYRARDVDFDASGSRFACETPDAGTVALELPLPGPFNVENALAALAAARMLGASYDEIARALAGADRVPGRFEPVDEGQGFAVLVDYAHTPDSLENALAAARRLAAPAAGRLLAVFGAGGDRDREKRPLMGEVAARLADRAIVTSDNPRSEDPRAIVAEIVAGVPRGRDGHVEVEIDRRRAIFLAVEAAAPGDVVVIAGKGHEQGQELEGGRREPFDDAEVAREALRARAGVGA